jgi:hypothetical protein
MQTEIYSLDITKHTYPSELNYIFNPEVITLVLKKSSCAVANCIRVFTTSIIPTKYMTFDLETIDTDQFFIVDQLRDTVQYTPIDQDCQLTETFAIEAVNNTNTPMYIKAKSSIKRNKPICNPEFTLSTYALNPHKYLRLPVVKIAVGNTFSPEVKPTPIQSFTYEILDFIPITLYHQFNITTVRIRKQDYPKNLSGKVLFYSHQSYEPLMKYFKRKAESSVVNKTNETFDTIIPLPKIEIYTSSNAVPKEFKLTFVTYGTKKAKTILPEVIDIMIDTITNMHVEFIHRGFILVIPYHLGYLMLDLLKEETKLKYFISMGTPSKRDPILEFRSDHPNIEELYNLGKTVTLKLLNSLKSQLSKI